jgi:hypothetical protein
LEFLLYTFHNDLNLILSTENNRRNIYVWPTFLFWEFDNCSTSFFGDDFDLIGNSW